MFEYSKRVEIVDILRFGSEVCNLLSILDLGLFKLLKSVLEGSHYLKVTNLLITSC